ncbi:MAG TPA: alcohol dehydrogenase catalytic domain-containing protein, partial [Nocardioides sp.]|nr:alcohol dehydrogenase catalytic domain-containing protein [Nocardioides sp.]
MRAVQVLTTTGPSDIVVTEVADPVAAPGQVLVEVHSVGISFPDLLLSRGEYQLRPEPPFTLGVDFAGVVVSGDGFAPGQRVAGVGAYGGAAELVVGSTENVFALPDAISFDEAVA